MSRFNNKNEISESMRTAEIRNSMITYEDMYNILYKQMIKLTRKDSKDAKSVEIWCSELRNENHTILYEEALYDSSHNNQVFAIMSPAQKNVVVSLVYLISNKN